jgi:hypothetical protein
MRDILSGAADNTGRTRDPGGPAYPEPTARDGPGLSSLAPSVGEVTQRSPATESERSGVTRRRPPGTSGRRPPKSRLWVTNEKGDSTNEAFGGCLRRAAAERSAAHFVSTTAEVSACIASVYRVFRLRTQYTL